MPRGSYRGAKRTPRLYFAACLQGRILRHCSLRLSKRLLRKSLPNMSYTTAVAAKGVCRTWAPLWNLSCLKGSLLGYPSVAASPFASRRSSVSGTANSAVPQFRQTTSSGNTHTTGLSMLFRPGKWMHISPVNLLCLSDPHDLQFTVRSLPSQFEATEPHEANRAYDAPYARKTQHVSTPPT
jgi:hypothetical protein